MEPKRLTPETLRGEVEITAYKSSGPGGQHKNKTESSIRIRHLPTGLTAIARESRSQIKNRELAWERLIEKLELRNRKKKPRIPTRISAAARAKRLQAKAERARKKAERARDRKWEED
ncbi:MAG: peptide chain release factor-like protein [bacterium]